MTKEEQNKVLEIFINTVRNNADKIVELQGGEYRHEKYGLVKAFTVLFNAERESIEFERYMELGKEK